MHKNTQYINIDNITHILDCKIQQITQMKHLLNTQLQDLNACLIIKNKLIRFDQNNKHYLQSLKQYYTYIQQIPIIMENIHLFNLYIIQQIQARYHQEYLRTKLKYQGEIKQLKIEIETQHKIKKTMIEQVQQLKKCMQEFMKQKVQQNNNNTNSFTNIVNNSTKISQKIVNHHNNLQIIQEEDQILYQKKQIDQSIQQTDTQYIKQLQHTNIKLFTPNLTQNTLPKLLNITNNVLHSSQQKIEKNKPFLEEFKKSIRRNLNLTNNSIQNSRSFIKTTDIFDGSSEELQFSQNNISSLPSTPKSKGNTTKFYPGDRQLLTNLNIQNENNNEVKLNGIEKYGNALDEEMRQQNSYLSAHHRKKMFEKNKRSGLSEKSKSKEKITIKEQKIKDSVVKPKQIKQSSQVKSYVSIKENHNISLKNPNSFFVGDKKLQIKYEGIKRDGKKNGSGIVFYSNGLTYQGAFKDNLRYGYGILKFNHIQIYNGEWQNDMIQGKGRIKNCSVINKKKKDNDSILSKWVSYTGEFKENKFHGNGTLNLQNGEKFVGKFKNGAADGQGTFYKKCGQIEIVVCKNDIFLQKF